MKKVIGVVVGFFALVLILGAMVAPSGTPSPATAVELCGQGRELKAAAGGNMTDQQIYDLACDSKKAQEGYDALYRKEYGE